MRSFFYGAPITRLISLCSFLRVSADFNLVIGFSSCCNVFQLVSRRELAPRAKRSAKSLWGGSPEGKVNSSTPGFEAMSDAGLALMSW